MARYKLTNYIFNDIYCFLHRVVIVSDLTISQVYILAVSYFVAARIYASNGLAVPKCQPVIQLITPAFIKSTDNLKDLPRTHISSLTQCLGYVAT